MGEKRETQVRRCPEPSQDLRWILTDDQTYFIATTRIPTLITIVIVSGITSIVSEFTMPLAGARSSRG